MLDALFYLGRARREEAELRRDIEERIIDFLEIQAYRKTPVGRLPYGLQKRVDLGRALSMEPQVRLLDEPIAGKSGRPYGRYSGLTLEPQNFPDAPNVPHFPSAALRPGDVYLSKQSYAFFAE